jgi:hypothetical protein
MILDRTYYITGTLQGEQFSLGTLTELNSSTSYSFSFFFFFNYYIL